MLSCKNSDDFAVGVMITSLCRNIPLTLICVHSGPRHKNHLPVLACLLLFSHRTFSSPSRFTIDLTSDLT